MRPIRRSDRQITVEEARELFETSEYGILSTVDTEGQPYGMPLSYVYESDAIYFHCAPSGHKLENIAHNPKVSFCVVGNTKVLPDKFATEYESAVAFGVASEVNGVERHNALLRLLQKYCPDFIKEGESYIQQKNKEMIVIKIEIAHISGKARR